MAVPDRARLVRIELDSDLSAAEGCLLVRGDERPFGLAGDWAGGGALVGSEPLVIAGEDDDPFELLDRQPVVEDADERSGERRRRRRLVRLPRLQPRRTARARAASPAAARAAARLRARLLRPPPSARPRTAAGGSRRCGRTSVMPSCAPGWSCCAGDSRRECASGRCGSAPSSRRRPVARVT